MSRLKRFSPWIAGLLVAATLGVFSVSMGGIGPEVPTHVCDVKLIDPDQRTLVMQRTACDACHEGREQACAVLTDRFMAFAHFDRTR